MVRNKYDIWEIGYIFVYIYKFNYKRGGIIYLFIFLWYVLKVEIRDMLRYKKFIM